MKSWKASSIVLLVLVWSGAALAQDAVKIDPAHYKVVFENESVRVLKIGYAPGGKSTMHQHPDSIVIPLSPSKVRFGLPDGKTQDSELANEAPQYMPAGTHNPTNVGTGAVDALLVEFKTAAPGKAALPTSRPGLELKVLAEGPRAIAYRLDGEPRRSRNRLEASTTSIRWSLRSVLARCRSRSTASPRKRVGHAATCSSSAAASRMRPRTPVESRWT